MKFRKLTIENYKSFQLQTDIEFPSGDDGHSIFLIGGMNGAGKTSIMEAVSYCLYGGKVDDIFRNINRREKAKGNADIAFELSMEMDDHSELIVKRSWTAGTVTDPKPRDLVERLVVVRDGKRVSSQNQQIWQDFIRAAIPPGITQFFFFDGEKIQEIAADDHSEVRLKSSLEAALGIQYINRLASDIGYIKQEERKGFVEISDEDLEFKQTEAKREQSKLARKHQEVDDIRSELDAFKSQLREDKRRFEATFNIAPESRETIREQEKRRAIAANRLAQVETEVRDLCEKALPFSIAGKAFDGLRRQIEAERESASGEAIKENAASLAKRIVRVVEEPEPIYTETLSPARMAELERRILCLLQEGDPRADAPKVLGLSERDAARVLNKIDTLERSDVFLLKPLLEEVASLQAEVRQLAGVVEGGSLSRTEENLYDDLQSSMESCSTQIGRKTEQLRLQEEDIFTLDKRISELDVEIAKLYERHNVSKEKADFLAECDAIASVLNQFVVRLRKNKVNVLQEKTLEMYRRLSSRSGLIKDITIDDETYEVHITDRNGHEIRKSALSAGEKEVFAIALLWGLAQTSELKLPIIIDTPLSRLDSSHRDNIVNSYFPNAGEQVIILSTDTEVDQAYYKALRPRLTGAARLEFDQRQELSTIKQGYFWEENHG
ncbi:MAG: DNA sulfur modification protein DndD [Armatimonadetes bacterium]|nr:DNA sulfur modification protein DndD [Armatimonadota bacterium]